VTHDLLQTNFPFHWHDIEAVLASKGDWEGELRHTRDTAPSYCGQPLVAATGRERGARRDSGNQSGHHRPQAAEAALERERRPLAGIIQSAMDSIITVDEEQRIVLFNCAAERIFRCPAAEALGQPITRFIPSTIPRRPCRTHPQVRRNRRHQSGHGAKHVLWAVRADGQEFQIEASISQVVIGGKNSSP
jgi:PAS domain S-box-containing protein